MMAIRSTEEVVSFICGDFHHSGSSKVKAAEYPFFLMQSVPLWCDYLKFVQEYDPSIRDCLPDGTSKARNLFERLLLLLVCMF
ncbi:hypothetical protein CUMW_249270 [Citrus unshiu]|uniref:Uncharacterized protein n=1 Tax=Citrus unshiu TaxID=55188 RepID=A0A2H5QPG3_CITUN|nr:hypothetical protein CUMW_249270 [Citrus unshiu]